MKVLLISANRLTVPFPVYPLGLDHVAGALEGRHEVLVLDRGTQSPQEIEEVLAAARPELVGISVRNIDSTDHTAPQSFVPELRALVGQVRRLCPGVPVVLGGAGYSIFPVELLAQAAADYGIVGEGERLGLLLEALERGERPAPDLPGLVLPGRSPGALPPPLPGPPDRRLPRDPAQLAYYLQHAGMLNLQTKRGCPYHCIYCTYPLIERRQLRLFAPERVAREARELEQAGARFLWITDALFNSDAEHSLAVARAMKAAGVSIPWGAFFAPFAPPAGYYAELADCGLTHVELGTESLADPVLAAYGKAFDAADVLAAHRAAQGAGLHLAHYFVLGGPGETRATLQQTLEQVERLEQAVLFFFCGMRIYPGTPLAALAVAQGMIERGATLLDPCYYHSSEVPPAEIQEQVAARARGRTSWVIGSGGETVGRIVARLHARGHVGPLWEKMIR